MTTENFIYGREILQQYLQKLINMSLELCFIPDDLKIGNLSSVYKNKGHKNDAKNYRGITITPMF